MSTPAIPLGGKCPLMPYFMGGQMSGRASVRTHRYLIVETKSNTLRDNGDCQSLLFIVVRC